MIWFRWINRKTDEMGHSLFFFHQDFSGKNYRIRSIATLRTTFLTFDSFR